jgi:hypothetical protein
MTSRDQWHHRVNAITGSVTPQGQCHYGISDTTGSMPLRDQWHHSVDDITGSVTSQGQCHYGINDNIPAIDTTGSVTSQGQCHYWINDNIPVIDTTESHLTSLGQWHGQDLWHFGVDDTIGSMTSHGNNNTIGGPKNHCTLHRVNDIMAQAQCISVTLRVQWVHGVNENLTVAFFLSLLSRVSDAVRNTTTLHCTWNNWCLTEVAGFYQESLHSAVWREYGGRQTETISFISRRM